MGRGDWARVGQVLLDAELRAEKNATEALTEGYPDSMGGERDEIGMHRLFSEQAKEIAALRLLLVQQEKWYAAERGVSAVPPTEEPK